MAYRISRFGWIPELPEQRDHLYAAPVVSLAALPQKVDLRPQCPPVYDQEQLGSATANSIAVAIQFDRRKLDLEPDFVPSRLFIYYNARLIENTVNSDSGAMIRNAIKSVARQGVCRETAWPYDITRFDEKPDEDCYHDALRHKILQYRSLVQTGTQMKGCLASGYPFVFGFTVYESFEGHNVAASGVVPMPGVEEAVIGGHCMLAVGYDDTQQRFILRNSWGGKWGMEGYCTMPYAYLTDPNLASDFWTIRLISA
jgi:C1A family cysteine protease